jgi:hypothetical protein
VIFCLLNFPLKEEEEKQFNIKWIHLNFKIENYNKKIKDKDFCYLKK